MQATYQTRIEGNDEALSAYAALYGRVQRRLFAEVSSGRSAASMKRDCVREYGIPARMFNAVRVSLEGKVSGAPGVPASAYRDPEGPGPQDRQGVGWRREEGVTGTGSIRRCAGWTTCGPGWRGSRPTRRRAWSGCCFGGRKLWRGQHNLEANGYGSHEEWLAGWRAARDGEFFVLGSRDETGGCQLCVAGVAGDGSLTLRLRLPDCLAGEHGKYLVIEGVKFAYGHGQVLAAPAGQPGVRRVQAPGRRKGGPGDLPGTGNIVPLQAG